MTTALGLIACLLLIVAIVVLLGAVDGVMPWWIYVGMALVCYIGARAIEE